MADSLLRAWIERLRGRLRPTPMPFSQAYSLMLPGRALVAGPERILGDFRLDSGERVLEVGPGVGYYSVAFARRVGPTGRLVCLDLQPEMLHATRGRFAAAGVEGDCIRANGLALPLRAGSVDRVVLITVLGELPDRAAGLAEVRRVLRPGGRLSVSEQLPDPDFVTRGVLRRELAAAGFVEERSRGLLWYTSTWRRPT
jgi:ubiquinone/menaquinone biosynthesis C-methylase UbiE